jgi:hypothetical protein
MWVPSKDGPIYFDDICQCGKCPPNTSYHGAKWPPKGLEDIYKFFADKGITVDGP